MILHPLIPMFQGSGLYSSFLNIFAFFLVLVIISWILDYQYNIYRLRWIIIGDREVVLEWS